MPADKAAEPGEDITLRASLYGIQCLVAAGGCPPKRSLCILSSPSFCSLSTESCGVVMATIRLMSWMTWCCRYWQTLVKERLH